MDYVAMSQSERGADLMRQWDERVTALRASAATSEGAAAFPDLLPLIMKLVPILTSLLTSGFTPAALLALIPHILKILLPDLDAGLLELLQKILAFFMGQ